MTETPTPDEIARWAAEHHGWTPEDYPDSGEFCVECGEHMPCPTTRLLALVAAQAEQNAAPCATCQGRNRATTDMVCMACGRDYMPDDGSDETGPGLGWLRLMQAWREQAKLIQANSDTLRAELSALRATDEYQRWARAVVERDAAREAVARVRALFAGGPDTPCRTVWQDGIECVSVPLDDLRAALEGGAAT